MKRSRSLFAAGCCIFVVAVIAILAPNPVSCQTDTFEGVHYTAPKGWAKTSKDGSVVYTQLDDAAKTFCILTVYGLRSGSGDPSRDFAASWRDLAVVPFAAEADPKTETQPAADGWTVTAGGSIIEMNGIKSAAILTVFSGYRKTSSILAIFNDQASSAKMEAFVEGIKLDKAFTIAPVSGETAAKGPVPAAAVEHWTLLREYQDNQVAADAKYAGKRVTIVGPMDMVLVENGKPVIRMGVPAWSGRQMFCIFPVSQKAAVASLKADRQVVLECTVLGIAGGVSKIGRVDLGSSVGRLTLDNCTLK